MVYCEFRYSSTKLESALTQNSIDSVNKQLQELEVEWTKLTSPEHLKVLAEKYMLDVMPKYNKCTKFVSG